MMVEYILVCSRIALLVSVIYLNRQQAAMSHVVILNLNTEHPSWTANIKISQGLFDGDPNI